MSDDKVYPNEKKLVTITEYSEKYQLNRNTVYRLMEEGQITRYIAVDGTPMLDPEEAPKEVRKYEDRPEYDEKDENSGD